MQWRASVDKIFLTTPVRVVVSTIATLVAYTASGWFGLIAWTIATMPFRHGGGDNPAFESLLMAACSIGGAVWAAWYTWRFTAGTSAPLPSGVLATTFRWAFIVGGVGFTLGFFGPMIFAPGANQGPMLGIFITGPIGFVLGAVTGFFRAERPGA